MSTQEVITVNTVSIQPEHILHQFGHLTADILLIGLMVLLPFFILKIFFCWSCYKTQNQIPLSYRLAPAGLCWLILIPVIGYIFEWIMLPFILPNSIRQYKSNDPLVAAKANSLMGVGLAFVILPLLSVIPLVNISAWIAEFILWIVYWVKIVDIRKDL